MIIACPTCARPFQVLDEQIAPLVQVACPHCSFRLILDFEAANEPSLIDPGTQMASGYRSEAHYRGQGAEAAEVTTTPPAPESPTSSPVHEPPAAPSPAPARRPAPKPKSRSAPPPPPHGTSAKPSKKTLIASPGMMADVPKAPPRAEPRVMAKTTSSQGGAPTVEEEAATSGESPHAPAPKAAAPGWPTEGAAPPPSPAELSGEHSSPELTVPIGGGALKASPAPMEAPRSSALTVLLFTTVVLLAFLVALWIVAFQKTGNVDPRPFIQQTLVPMLRLKLPMLFGG
jgi:DNA-directed RNA polymerase subunit RPC12/RpoP